MSIKLVKGEIQRFLKNNRAESICLMGKWGVGKTFAWNKYLKEAVDEKAIGFSHYSYVSLFGLNSLNDLKHSIFENTVPIIAIASGPNLATFKLGVVNVLEKIGRRSIRVFQSIPKLKDISPLLERSFFLAVRNQLVCFDDLERVGKGLSAKDVLGLISFLKEQRNCKIALLLNDDKLEENDSKDFKSQLEKVIDVELRFVPEAIEAADIAIDKKFSFHEKFSKTSIALGITNIRVVRKIQRLISELEDLLIKHDKRILDSAITSLVIFGWAKYEQESGAPTFGYVKNFLRYNNLISSSKKENENEKKWRELLNLTDYTNFDELDQLILDSVERGYFDPDLVEKMAIAKDKEFLLHDKDSSFHNAWRKYHDSFECNEKEVLDGLFDSFKKCIESISPMNVDGTVCLFRKFDRNAQADEMIAYYMVNRNEKAEFFDRRRSAFLDLKDQALSKAFSEKLLTFHDNRAPKEILIHIAQSSGWNPEDITELAKVTSDQFYEIFKHTEGDDLRIMAAQAVKFKNYNPHDANMDSISANAEEALKRIGLECKINKERVSVYGINVGDTDSFTP